MALEPPAVVHVEIRRGASSVGDTMNAIRTWLDHRKIQPESFRSVAETGDSVSFEIGFKSQAEAHLFRREFDGAASGSGSMEIARPVRGTSADLIGVKGFSSDQPQDEQSRKGETAT